MTDETIPVDRETMTWCIRYLPTDLVKKCARLAKSRDMLIGEWVTLALEAAVEREGMPDRIGQDADLAARLHQLEAEVRELRQSHRTEMAHIQARVSALEPPAGKTKSQPRSVLTSEEKPRNEDGSDSPFGDW